MGAYNERKAYLHLGQRWAAGRTLEGSEVVYSLNTFTKSSPFNILSIRHIDV